MLDDPVMKDFSDILSPELLEYGQDLFEGNEGLMEEERMAILGWI